ncbi:hypothetical protein ACLB1Q_11095 [Escherichia coli]
MDQLNKGLLDGGIGLLIVSRLALSNRPACRWRLISRYMVAMRSGFLLYR